MASSPSLTLSSSHRAVIRPQWGRRWGSYLFAVPAVFFLAIFAIYPMISLVVFSFQQIDLGSIVSGNTPFAGVSNYQQAWSDPVFSQSLRTSILFTLGSVCLQFLLGFVFALLFTQRFPLASVMRSLVMISWVLPIIVSATVFKWLLQEHGLVNSVLVSAHVIQQPVFWLEDPRAALLGLIIANVWLGFPFYLALLSAGLQGISPTLYEAATVDGASSWQKLRYITLPAMRSTSLITLTLGLIYTLNVFDLIYIMTGGGPANATEVLPIYAYQQFFQFYNLGVGSAVTVLIFILMLGIASVYLWLIRREEVIA